MMKQAFYRLSSVLFLTLIFLMFIVTIVCAENRTPIDKHQTKLIGVAAKITIGNDIIIDSTGNYYITGETTGNLDGQIKTGKWDAFIAKYDKNGNKQWTKLLGIQGNRQYTESYSVALDSADNCYIVGQTTGNLDGQTKTGDLDAFIVKYDTNGNKQWTKLIGAIENVTKGLDIAIDTAGNCYITGSTSGNLDGQIITGDYDAFIAKYDVNGNKQWTRLLGATLSNAAGTGIVLDSINNCYIVGDTGGNLDGQIKTGDLDAFIVKYDTNGNKQWIKLLGVAENYTSGSGIAIDSSANCYITGGIRSNLDGWAYIVKYDTDGNKQGMAKFGVAEKVSLSNAIAIDSVGNCCITGYTNGSLDGQIKIGEWDAFVVEYDKNLIKQGIEKLFRADGKETLAKSIALDSVDNCYITGSTNGNLDGQMLIGKHDAFVISIRN